MAERSHNKEVFEKYVELVPDHARYIGILDGDVVDTGSNFNNVMINVSELRKGRGLGVEMDVFDSQEEQKAS